eukprot:jgi/Bigna1/143498/aug1.79_g18206
MMGKYPFCLLESLTLLVNPEFVIRNRLIDNEDSKVDKEGDTEWQFTTIPLSQTLTGKKKKKNKKKKKRKKENGINNMACCRIDQTSKASSAL